MALPRQSLVPLTNLTSSKRKARGIEGNLLSLLSNLCCTFANSTKVPDEDKAARHYKKVKSKSGTFLKQVLLSQILDVSAESRQM